MPDQTTSQFVTEIAAFALAAIPLATLYIKDVYKERKDRAELAEHNKKLTKKVDQATAQVESNTVAITEQTIYSEAVDSEMRRFILQIARESNDRILAMEQKMESMTKEGAASVLREQTALAQVDTLKSELAVAKFQIKLLTDRIFELENQLGIPHALPNTFIDTSVKPA